ncbi:hypothetical protein [Ilumatobacter sp.]
MTQIYRIELVTVLDGRAVARCGQRSRAAGPVVALHCRRGV